MKFKKFIFCFLVSLLLTLSYNNSFAFVNCQGKYDSDKRALPSLKGNCGVCHINPSGSGPQNEFGMAFKAAGFMITDELVAQFPTLFKQADETSESALPFINRIKPKTFVVGKETVIMIKGKNFVEGVKAFIDNNEVITNFKSSMLLIVNFLFDVVGTHELKVQNPDSTESNTVNLKVKNKSK